MMDLSRFEELAAQSAVELQALACRKATDESGDAAGVSACRDAGAEEGCRWRRSEHCPIWRIDAKLNAYSLNLSRSGVPARECDILLNGARGTVPLRKTDSMSAVRRVLENGPPLVVLAGPRGVGKTVAACYALAKWGGKYLTAYQFARPGLDIDELKRERAIVVDQLGRENVGASEFALASLEELIDARYANRRLTLLVGNITREQFEARYGGIIEDRLRGDGEFVLLGGESMRGEK